MPTYRVVSGDDTQVTQETFHDVELEREDGWPVFFRGRGAILRIQEALNAMDRLDREVLTLRHFEKLTVGETAKELGIEESVAAKRYIVALKRLKEILASS